MERKSPKHKSIFTLCGNQIIINEGKNAAESEIKSNENNNEEKNLSDHHLENTRFQRDSGDNQNTWTPAMDAMDTNEKEDLMPDSAMDTASEKVFDASQNFSSVINNRQKSENNLINESDKNTPTHLISNDHFDIFNRNSKNYTKESESVVHNPLMDNNALSLFKPAFQTTYSNKSDKTWENLFLQTYAQNADNNALLSILNWLNESRCSNSQLKKVNLVTMRNNLNEKVTLFSLIEGTEPNFDYSASNSLCSFHSLQPSSLSKFTTENQTNTVNFPASSSNQFANNDHIRVIEEDSICELNEDSAGKACGHTESDVLLPVLQFLKSKRYKPAHKTKSNVKKAKSERIIKQNNVSTSTTNLPLFIAEVLKTTHPRLSLCDSVCQKIELFVRDLIYRVGDEAELLMTLTDKKNFTPRVLKYSIKLCLEHLKNEADVSTGKKTSWLF